MKLLKKISLAILIIFFCSTVFCCRQSDWESEWPASVQAEVELVKKGVRYGSQGKFDEAREVLEKGAARNTYGKQGHLTVLEYIDQQKIKAETGIHYFKGIEYVIEQQWDKALEEFDKAIEINPMFAGGYVSKYGAYLNKGDYENAISTLSKIKEINLKLGEDANKIEPRPLSHLQYIRSDEEAYRMAVDYYSKVLKLNPDNAEAYKERASIYYLWGKYEELIPDLNKAIELNPDNAEAYKERARIYYNWGKYEEAIADYNKIIELNPEDPERYINRGRYYHILGEMQDRPFFMKVISFFGQDIDGLEPGGPIKEQNYYAKAVSDYSRAIDLSPENHRYYSDRGDIYDEMELFEMAIADYSKALNLVTEMNNSFNYFYDTWYRKKMAYIYVKLEQFDKVIFEYSKIIELYPRNIEALISRADVYAEMKDYDNAVADYNRFIELSPGDDSAYITRGNLYDEAGDLSNACSDWKKAFSMGNRKGWSIVNRIRCLGK
ncbi:tetratricopeptide repeat protein [Thermodesulfobacteriota bacterium]